MAKILIVDDSPDLLIIFSNIVEMLKDEPIPISSGDRLLEKIIHYLPDVIILDVLLNGNNGKELCKAIRATEATKHIPVILVSASAGILEDYEICGATAIIEKPFDIDEVQASINAVLGRS